MRFALAAVLAALLCRACPADPVIFRDDFARYRRSTVLDGWDVGAGKTQVRGSALELEARGYAPVVPFDAPDLDRQVMEVTVTPDARTSSTAWSAAALVLQHDAANFWRLELVQGPKGDYYAELVESLNTVWQAQNEPATRLPSTGPLPPLRWSYGKPYRLRLTLAAGQILGEVLDAGAVVWRQGFGLPAGARAVRSGRLALAALDMRARFADPMVAGKAPAAPARSPQGRLRVAVHGGGAVPVAASLARQGYAVRLAADDAVIAGLSRTDTDMVVFTDAADCPIEGRDALLRFLRQGGHMIGAGGPLFDRSVARTRDAWKARLAAQPTLDALAAPGADATAGWWRSSNNPQSGTAWVGERAGPADAPAAMHVRVPGLTGWDVLVREAPSAFRPGATLTTLWARGGPNTHSMSVEWQEKDGSRWIAAVPLTPEWKCHVLEPADFRYWSDNESKGRGGPGDLLRPEAAARMQIGLAVSTSAIATGSHEYWVAGLGTAAMPEGARLPDLDVPTLELFSPWYKVYRLPSLRPTAAQLRRSAATGNQTGPVVSPIARPRGLGFDVGRRYRWIPLEPIRDEAGRVCGTRESLLVNLVPPFRGSIWGHIAVTDPAVVAAAAGRMARRIEEGLFVARGGAGQFSYFTDEAVPLGAQAVNFGVAARRVTLTVRVMDAARKRTLHTETERATPAARRNALVTGEWRPRRSAPGLYVAITELRAGGRIMDRVEQEFTLLADPNSPASAFVTVKSGRFMAPPMGRPDAPRAEWRPYGVNYWQSNIAGGGPESADQQWINPGYYDPEVVERDLATLQRLGFTSVSLLMSDPAQVRQVNDVAWRAARRGIRTNLFVAGAHPFTTDRNLYTRLIREGRFGGNANVWAFDIAWEHHLGSHDERARWDRDWEEWVIDQYGTVEHAERVWGVPIPRDGAGKVTNPPDNQLRDDGPWLKMVTAYERCADDVISRRYGRIIRDIRSMAPRRLISARSASQPSWSQWFAFDLVSSGKHFDFSSPEGYGLDPAEAGFTVAYARWAAAGKPVFWAEFGASIYPYDTTGERADAQRKLHEGFADMLLRSGADGLCSWWSVGGYRVDEKSDYGIIAPDGTPRAAALELARRAGAAASPGPVKQPTTWVTIDRDLHAAAYEAVYQAHKRSYTEAAATGGMVGVRTEGTGTTSADCPLTAVGNAPYDGFMPLKHLNAEFTTVEVLDAAGKWVSVPRGGSVTVAPGRPVQLRVAACNLGEARWVTEGDGAVRLIGDDRLDARSGARPRLPFAVPLAADAPRFADIRLGPFIVAANVDREVELTLTFEAAGRARFGERYPLTLKPSRP